MSSSLKRVKLQNLVKNLASFQEEYLHFILTNKSVILARPQKLEKKILLVKNTRGKLLKLPLQSLAEIWMNSKLSND